jgi:hypothetical protein
MVPAKKRVATPKGPCRKLVTSHRGEDSDESDFMRGDWSLVASHHAKQADDGKPGTKRSSRTLRKICGLNDEGKLSL